MKNVSKVIFLLLSLHTGLVFASSGGGTTNTPYFEIATPFVVNIQSEDGLVFLQVKAQFKVKKPELKSQLTKHMPAIQHTMMMVLSEQTQNDIRSVKGKEKLRGTALKEVQTLLKKQIGDEAVDEIYFTGFIIQ